MDYPKVSDDLAVQEHYVSMRRQGESHSVAEMLALQQTPRIFTEDVFRAQYGVNGEQFAKDPKRGDLLKAVAEKHGQNVKGKIYMPSLCRKSVGPGDPEAWVDGFADAVRIAEKRGDGIEDGPFGLRREMREPDQPKRCKLAPDIVADIARRKMANDPKLKEKRKEELVEQVTAEHGRQDGD